MKKQTKLFNSKGFTMVEIMAVVAIIGILFAVAMIPISKSKRDLRQTELDSRAELIFMAAQNELMSLQASGRSDLFKTGAKPMGRIPMDAEDDRYEADDFVYVASADKWDSNNAAAYVLPQGKVESELWDANWVIEYDIKSGSVYAVFYGEEEFLYTPETMDSLRYKNQRIENGAKIGYYGGDSVGAYETGTLEPTVSVVNGEQLYIKIVCNTQAGAALNFFVTLEDEDGNKTEEIKLERLNGEVERFGLTYTAKIMLDDLSKGEGMRFLEQERFKMLTPGQNLTASVKVTSNSDLIDEANIQIPQKINSLFAETKDSEKGKIAVITSARHLQNLDEASGVNSGNGKVFAAVQEEDINFVSAAEDSWSALYGDMTFKPIKNNNLLSYDSTCVIGGVEHHPLICDLPINSSAQNLGLFESFSNAEIKHVRLAGAKISGGENVGGIVGEVKGNVTMESCQVFLSPAKGHTAENEKYLRISGSVSGGLVGSVANGASLTVKDSFAATVLEGTTAAGGLVGNVSGTLSVQKSYADSYVYSVATGGAAGGLIGTKSGKASLLNCYSAGFLKGGLTSGISAGNFDGKDSLENVYNACALLEESENTYAIAPVGASMPVAAKVFYLTDAKNDITGATNANYADWSGENRKDAAAKLSDAFTGENNDTYAYNLKEGLGLSLYSYPKLAGIPHYGDWQAEFESGSLIYYEKYVSSYGFRGANVSTLSNTATVLGDGYGMVYEGSAPTEVEVKFEDRESIKLYGTDAIEIETMEDGEKKTYALLPLPGEMVSGVALGDKFYHKIVVDGKTYFYHPHFANIPVSGEEEPASPERISVRTSRHLYALSESFEGYAKFLEKNTTFLQERDIDYTTYDWVSFGKEGKVITEQHPIGHTEAASFSYSYNGGYYTIMGVSIVGSKEEPFVGLFGYNSGDLQNIVFVSNEPLGSSKSVSIHTEKVIQRRTVYMGMLAGYNDGTIYNCAVSGYKMQNNAYSGSVLYVGGLVGHNDGAIRSCSAVAPNISSSSTYAKVFAGGFVGSNSGQIRQSYTMAAIEAASIRGGGVTISGFAGINYGSIRESYCATALTSAGALTYGFTEGSGSLSNCYFLNGGTYSFKGEVHLYEFTDGSLGAKAVTDKELMALNLNGFESVSATDTFCYPNTSASATDGYLYPGSVEGRSGNAVHYGDWATKADLGTLGVVYWEKEEGGTNDGYHFSFIGFDKGVKKTGSSLCEAHDDGGSIVKYGYGYYWKDGEPSVMLSTEGFFRLDGRTNEAASALKSLVPGYTFVAFETGDGGLRLTSVSEANGRWRLTQQGGSSYDFEICPFFAESYGYVSDVATDSAEPGSDDLPYHIRSVKQLQYINWSVVSGVGSAKRDVTISNYRYFPYLQYTKSTGRAQQTKYQAIVGDSVGGARPIRSWKQSHDLNGSNSATDTFQPIAGAVYNNNTTNKYSVVLYNWFGGKYDGQDYYIKNINIDSYCYNVGVFGTTAGAEIRNIVLYSDNNAVIRRSSDPTSWDNQRGTPSSVREYQCSYALGGLIGIAYDYSDNMGKGTVSNCSMAGYIIEDNSRNLVALGEVAVGGLIGVSSVNLENCSAVADIRINCTHRWKNDSSLNSALYGNFVRVGGLVGGLRYTATNCYSGGTIKISDETLKERIGYSDRTNQDFQDGSQAVPVKWSRNRDLNGQANQWPATYVYIGGIGGSGFSANFTNFSNKDGSDDGTPTFRNCYTYIDLPDMKGTITGISLIGSVADRYGSGTNAKLIVENCYYLDSTKDGIGFGETSKYYYPGKESLANLLKDKNSREAMLNGNLNYLGNYVWDAAGNKHTIRGLTELTYEQMSDRIGKGTLINITNGASGSYRTFKDALGSGFEWVTIEEQGASIHGKYSFPGEDLSLKGQDYPFPTVLTQEDAFGKTVNIHYGSWPKVGLFWSEGITTVDLIADYHEDTKQSSINLVLRLDNVSNDALLGFEPTFAYTNENVVEAVALRNETGDFDVTLKGLGVGATEVTATIGSYTARMMVTVTAEMVVTADPGIADLKEGETKTVTLAARNCKGEAINAAWQIINEEETIATNTAAKTAPDGTVTTTVTGVSEGETSLSISAKCTLSNGMTFDGATVLNVIVQKDIPATDIVE